MSSGVSRDRRASEAKDVRPAGAAPPADAVTPRSPPPWTCPTAPARRPSREDERRSDRTVVGPQVSILLVSDTARLPNREPEVTTGGRVSGTYTCTNGFFGRDNVSVGGLHLPHGRPNQTRTCSRCRPIDDDRCQRLMSIPRTGSSRIHSSPGTEIGTKSAGRTGTYGATLAMKSSIAAHEICHSDMRLPSSSIVIRDPTYSHDIIGSNSRSSSSANISSFCTCTRVPER
jgi:hypothetical protein